ncbi:MAG: hypothetical protein PHQ43_01045 [Dehalococcoidales bacterium]|nr:hypothetical protein [Dehalococcoidales bacterium]
MTDHSKATPRPIELPITGEVMKHTADIRDARGRLVCKIEHGATGRSMAICRVIVEAVNNHDRLAEENKRLREALKEIDRDMNVAMMYKRANKGVVVETQRIARDVLRKK